MVFNLEDSIRILRIVNLKNAKEAGKLIREKYPKNSEVLLEFLFQKQNNDKKKSQILKTLLYGGQNLVNEIFEKNPEKNINFLQNIIESFPKNKNEKEIFEEINRNFTNFRFENPTKNLEFFSKNYEKISQNQKIIDKSAVEIPIKKTLQRSASISEKRSNLEKVIEKPKPIQRSKSLLIKRTALTENQPELQKVRIIENLATQQNQNKSEERIKLENSLKNLFSEKTPIKSIEKYANDLIYSYKEFKKSNPRMNDELALKSLNLIADSRKNNKKNLESIFSSIMLKEYDNLSKLIANKNLFISDDLSKQKARIQENFENKFLMKNYKNFSKPDQNLQKINEKAKNSKDAIRIYEFIAKTQKIETEKGAVSRMQKETDYLEKIMDAFKKYKGKADLTIKDLKNFIESSNDGVETTRALINFYDSRGKVGKNYLDNFAFNKGLNTGIDKNDPNYSELWNKGIIETAQKAKNFSANVIILSDDQKGGSLASSILYKIDKENGIAYFLTNEHVVNHKNVENVKIQPMNSDLSKAEYKAQIVGFSNKHDIGLIAVKFPKKDIERMNEPKINEKIEKNQGVILIGNSHGTGSNDFSTNVTTGSVIKSNSNEINYNSPSFSGNSGGGLWNEQGELIGIHARSSVEKDRPYEKNYATSVPISAAKKIADDLIQKYEKQNNLQNGISGQENNQNLKPMRRKSFVEQINDERSTEKSEIRTR